MSALSALSTPPHSPQPAATVEPLEFSADLSTLPAFLQQHPQLFNFSLDEEAAGSEGNGPGDQESIAASVICVPLTGKDQETLSPGSKDFSGVEIQRCSHHDSDLSGPFENSSSWLSFRLSGPFIQCAHPCVLRSSSSCSLHFLTGADDRRLRPSPTPMASSRSVHAAPSVATQCASRIRFSCQPAKYAGKDISGLQTKSCSLQLLGLLGDL
jgi:hypothetical protein